VPLHVSVKEGPSWGGLRPYDPEGGGLDSGFPHLNHLTDGLGVGLFVLAAPPSRGKTTLAWQLCCQAADRNKVPALFVSYEQSADELRARALARLGRLSYRHVLRARFRSGDPVEWGPVLKALENYARISPFLTVAEAGPTTTVDVIAALVREKMAAHRATTALLAVDYLQVIPPSEAEAADDLAQGQGRPACRRRTAPATGRGRWRASRSRAASSTAPTWRPC
jgi:replicative DNA helicase